MVTTVAGNALVIASYRTNRRLRTINNMFLVSLACSDLVIGVVSMTLYPLYMITREWMFGPVLCDVWLCIDYTLSMASVSNLMLICCDRYFSVTRPFTYRAKRTRSRTRYFIVMAWVLSFLLWSPAIVLWPITHTRTVPDNQCYIQFLQEDSIITLVTALIAFYLPVLVMAILYGLIFRETRKCSKYLEYLSNRHRRSRAASLASPFLSLRRRTHFRRESSVNHPRVRAASLNTRPSENIERASNGAVDRMSVTVPCGQAGQPTRTSQSQIEASDKSGRGRDSTAGGSTDVFVDKPERRNEKRKRRFSAKKLRIKFTKPPVANPSNRDESLKETGKEMTYLLTPAASHPLALFPASCGGSEEDGEERTNVERNGGKRSPVTIPSSEKKAGRTLSAILLAFFITWLPYNVCAVYWAFSKGCIPQEVWDAAYYLCYINSTINPFCFALCNKTFRKTFVQLLSCEKRRSNVSISLNTTCRSAAPRPGYHLPSSSSS